MAADPRGVRGAAVAGFKDAGYEKAGSTGTELCGTVFAERNSPDYGAVLWKCQGAEPSGEEGDAEGAGGEWI